MTEEFEWFGGRGFESATATRKSRFYQIKLHAKGSGPPKMRPVSPDAQLAHVEPLCKIERPAEFWA